MPQRRQRSAPGGLAGAGQPARGGCQVAAPERDDRPADEASRIVSPLRCRLAVRRVGVVQAAQLFERESQVVQCRGPGARLLDYLPEKISRLVPARLPKRDERQIEGCIAFRGPEVGHAAELALSFVEHARLVERDAEIPVLLDAGIVYPRARWCRRGRAD